MSSSCSLFQFLASIYGLQIKVYRAYSCKSASTNELPFHLAYKLSLEAFRKLKDISIVDSSGRRKGFFAESIELSICLYSNADVPKYVGNALF